MANDIIVHGQPPVEVVCSQTGSAPACKDTQTCKGQGGRREEGRPMMKGKEDRKAQNEEGKQHHGKGGDGKPLSQRQRRTGGRKTGGEQRRTGRKGERPLGRESTQECQAGDSLDCSLGY